MKRKKSKKMATNRAESVKTNAKSFWTNGGMQPVPAVNTGRPFDFQIGHPIPSSSMNPYEFGSSQYVVTNYKVNTTWYQATSFDTTVSKLYQAIRENLRSNLAYTETALKAYLMNVMYIQALCSVIERDFAFETWRDSTHPTFEKVWGRQVPYLDYDITNLSSDSALVTPSVKKTYLTTDNYADSLTFLETVLIPRLNLIIIPPAMSEYLKWLFGNVFVDETSLAHAQYYWNEVRDVPFYSFSSGTISLAYVLDSSTLSLSTIADIVSGIAADYGIIIADLKRSGAQMVTPQLRSPVGLKLELRYDEIYFTSLENSYTNGFVESSAGVPSFHYPEFFNVDFRPGMNTEQMCTALSSSGGLIRDASDLVKPMFITSQEILVYIDENTELLPNILNMYSDGTVTSVGAYPPGTYAIQYTSNIGEKFAVNTSGTIVKASSFSVGDPVYCAGTGDSTWNGSDITWHDFQTANWIFIPIGECTVAGSAQVLGIEVGSSGWTVTAEPLGGGTIAYVATRTLSGTTHDVVAAPTSRILRYGAISASATSVATPLTLSAKLKIIWIEVPGRTLRNVTVSIEAAETSSPATTTVAFTLPYALFGSLVLGPQVTTGYSATLDPTYRTVQWISQEVEHHIPFWDVSRVVDEDLAKVYTQPVALNKSTLATTTYSRTELEALLYQMYYSLYTVHALSTKYKPA